MFQSRKFGFTLVELIVVITILAILGTIGVISMGRYSQSAREAARVSDLTNIEKALTFFHTTENYFPDPTDFISISYSGSLAWKQGVFGDSTRVIVGRIDESPTDPLTGNLYAYSVTNNRQEFELGAISETPLASLPSITNTTYAANDYFTNIVGNYNKQIVTVKEPTRLYILGVPTLITSEITDVTVQDILTNGTFSIKNSKSLPASYATSLPEDQTLTDGISFTPGTVSLSAPLIYDGSVENLNDDNEKQIFADNLVSYYQGSNLDNNDRKDLKNITSGNELAYINTLIQNDTGGIPGRDIVVNDSIVSKTITVSSICSDVTSDFKYDAGLITGFEDNIWNPQGNGTGSFPENICLDYDINSLPTAQNPWVAHWSIPGDGSNVIAFPNLYFGHKPWVNSQSGVYGDQILDRNISFSYNYNIDLDEGYSNVYNASLNLWLTSTQTASASGIDAEIMVWTENNGLTPAGTLQASGISIGGQTYSLYRQNGITDASGNQPGAWDYYAFVSSSTQRTGTLPVRDFLQYLVSNQGLDSNLYMHQVEFGPEIVQGKGVISYTQASVNGLDILPVDSFTFPAVSYTANDPSTRVTSQYVDIGNLTEIPRTFVVTSNDNGGNPVATSGNIIGGETYAQNGELIYGTALEVDIPNKGETRIVSLNVDGVVGSWQVSRASSPFAGFTVNDFTLTSGVSFYQLNYSAAGIPDDFYTFSIVGTGNTNPRLQQFATGTATNGTTQNWGINIDLDNPPTGVQETITLVIDGETVTWQITGP